MFDVGGFLPSSHPPLPSKRMTYLTQGRHCRIPTLSSPAQKETILDAKSSTCSILTPVAIKNCNHQVHIYTFSPLIPIAPDVVVVPVSPMTPSWQHLTPLLQSPKKTSDGPDKENAEAPGSYLCARAHRHGFSQWW
jgi:hypothetical protein